MASHLSRFSAFDPVLEVAESEQNLRQALFDSVSAQDTYRNIFKRIVSSPRLFLLLAAAFGSHLLHSNFSDSADREGQ